MNRESVCKRILLVSPRQVHPTLSGGNLRTFSLANALAKQGNDVFVYSFVGRKNDYLERRKSEVQVWDGGVEEYVNRSIRSFVAGYGSYWLGLDAIWLSAYLRMARALRLPIFLPKLLRERLKWCDVVIADSPFVYPILQAKEDRCIGVLNTHNVEHHLYDPNLGWRNKLLRNRVRSIEDSAAGRADVVVSCSEDDRRYFEGHARAGRSILVPNGIDPENFHFPIEVRQEARADLGVTDADFLVLFTASKWGPNQEAFDYLSDFARRHERELVDRGIHFLVVGNVVEEPLELPALTATGRVDTVGPYFAAADAAINPIESGAGTNVKMGEFIAAGLPMLVSEFGSRGYNVEHERNSFVFERDNLLASLMQIRELFDSDPVALQRIANRALLDNAQFIDMNECVKPLLAILDRP